MKRKIDFIGVGAAKCGTTWLFECLNQHPQILVPLKKELYFFYKENGHIFWENQPSKYDRGIGWYLDQFPDYEKGKVRGEMATNYYRDSQSPKLINNHFPNINIIVILRNPVDMLYSLFWFGKATVSASLPETFDKFIEKKKFLDRGLFFKHLSRYYDFFDENQIYVMLLDDVKRDSVKAVTDLYHFLKVKSDFVPLIIKEKVNSTPMTKNMSFKKVINIIFKRVSPLLTEKMKLSLVSNNFLYRVYQKVNQNKVKYPPMDRNLRKELIEYYRNDIKKLEKLIGRDLSKWKK